jgi:hypothetical protein
MLNFERESDKILLVITSIPAQGSTFLLRLRRTGKIYCIYILYSIILVMLCVIAYVTLQCRWHKRRNVFFTVSTFLGWRNTLGKIFKRYAQMLRLCLCTRLSAYGDEEQGFRIQLKTFIREI